MSTIILFLKLSFISVPNGILTIISSPFFPDLEFDDPGLPLDAIYFFLYLKS